MIFHKRKHSKYKTKLNDSDKRLQIIKNKNKKIHIMENLYSLPLDIKIKIFRFALISNMIDWSTNHRKKFVLNLEFILNAETREYINRSLHPDIHYHSYDYFGYNRNIKKYRHINSNSRWYYIHSDLMYYKYKHLCQRKIRRQSYIISVCIPDNLYEEIDNRENPNSPGFYWYHQKCRCMKCDLVRVIGAKNNSLSEKEQHVFSFIDWPVWSDQWINQSINQSINPKQK